MKTLGSIVKGVGSFLFFGFVAIVYFAIQNENSPEYILKQAKESVAQDAVEQFTIARRQGDPIQTCVQAQFVAAAYLQAKDEHNYNSWKAVQAKVCGGN